MSCKMITVPQFWAEDEAGDFEGLYETGEDITVTLYDGTEIGGTINWIYDDEIVLEDNEYNDIRIKYDDILCANGKG